MRPRRKRDSGVAGSHRRRGWEGGDDVFWLDSEPPDGASSQSPQTHLSQSSRAQQAAQRHLRPAQPPAPQPAYQDPRPEPDPVRHRRPALPDDTGPIARTPGGWRVGDEEVPDLTSAMVLADLLAADLPTESLPAVAPAPAAPERSRSRQ